MDVSTDIGGTFTDFVILEDGRLKTFKVPSTPQNPALSVKQGLEELKPSILSHGTTVATNAVLERKGAKVALITTKGFKDILRIGRQSRPSLYDFSVVRPEPYVSDDLCFEVDERISAEGEVLKKLNENELIVIQDRMEQDQVEAVAVSFLFSFLKPEHEMRIAKTLTELPVSISSSVLPEFREYERTSTTVFDAYVKPTVARYISDIESTFGNRFYIMQSNGGVTTSNMACEKPVNILLSGPAGGVSACQSLGKMLGISNLISFDMGGTSADISLIVNGEPQWTSQGSIGGLPVRVPMLDINTIGAGGGSIVWIDSGGALRVGPESAGAEPGPICYGKGGKDITVTDCNLLAGYLGEGGLLGGKMQLQKEPVEKKVHELSEKLGMTINDTILGVQKVVNSNMISAIRLTLANYGLDPRDFTLVAFGGAGPMHACALARDLGMKKILVPFLPGAYSAYGILVSDIRLSLSKSVLKYLEDAQNEIEIGSEDLNDQAIDQLKKQGISEKDADFLYSLDLRYKGQSYDINVNLGKDLIGSFNKKHKGLYGYSIPSEPLELVNIRLNVISQRKKIAPEPKKKGNNEPKENRNMLFDEGEISGNVFIRDNLNSDFSGSGPAVIEEETATTVIPPKVHFKTDSFGVIHLEVN
jgi:N-methylhydantoinase A